MTFRSRLLLGALLFGCSSPPVVTETHDAGQQTDAGGLHDDAGTSDDAGLSSDAGAIDAGRSTDAGETDAGLSTDAGLMYRDAGPIPDAGACLLNPPESICSTRDCCQNTDTCAPLNTECPNGDIAMRCRYGSDCGAGLKCFLTGNKAACSINGPANSELLCNPNPPADGGVTGCPPAAPNCVRAAGLLYACRP